jgi:hypothetical protein
MCLEAFLKTKSIIPTSVQYVTLQRYFSHPSLVIYFFGNLAHKTETWTANRWELPVANQLIILIGQSKTGSSSQIIFITLFSSR